MTYISLEVKKIERGGFDMMQYDKMHHVCCPLSLHSYYLFKFSQIKFDMCKMQRVLCIIKQLE